MRIDVRPEWKPVITSFEPDVTNSGIEEIGFEFPKREYGGHFSELGFNAVAFSGVAHCWAMNLLVINSDSGVFAAGRFCTIDGLRCETRGVNRVRSNLRISTWRNARRGSVSNDACTLGQLFCEMLGQE